jgi:NAD(P)H-hydrate repair Nnr-like enzyme with NAD(P)H-hydrate dehydratase domain
MPSPERPTTPAHVAAAMAALLAGYGLTRIYVAACQLIAVISASTA